jgi:hypothetical protein
MYQNGKDNHRGNGRTQRRNAGLQQRQKDFRIRTGRFRRIQGISRKHVRLYGITISHPIIP